MAVRLTVYYKEDNRHETYPVAFQTIFEEVWHPLAIRLGLEIVPRMNALRFSAQNAAVVDALIAELTQLAEWVNTSEDWVSAKARTLQLPERIDDLINALKDVQNNWADIESISIC